MHDWGLKMSRRKLTQEEREEAKQRQSRGKFERRMDARMIERRPCADMDRRKKLEASDEEWLLHYFKEAFPKPFGQVHRDMISAARLAFTTGEKVVEVAPRGTGKTTVFQAFTTKLILSGEAPFPAFLPWDAKGVKKALRFWKNALCYNARIAEDYPEYVSPFVASKGSSQRCKVFLWADTQEPTGAELLISSGLIVFPDRRGVIGSATINGNPRGLNHSTEDGKVWRPSFALIDDAQSKEVAKSAQQVTDTIDVIDTDVAGMAGPDARMPIFLLGTILRRGDVVDKYTARRDWHCVKVSQITSWPKRMDLWDEFGEMVKDKNETGAREFYAEHMDAMKEGAAVSWDDRYDAKRGEPDAVYSAMRDYYFMGRDAFMAERQGEPEEEGASQYTISAAIVCAHAVDLPRLHIPHAANIFVGHCDINRSGLHWAMAGFDQGMTPHVAAYGRWPGRGELWAKNANAQYRQVSIYRALSDLFGQVAKMAFFRDGVPTMPVAFLVDASYESETVHRFAEAWRGPFKIIPAIGRAAHKYRWSKQTIVGRPAEQCHLQRPQSRHCPYAMFNADHWREIMQRAFLGAAGEPGGCTLFAVDNPKAHMPFAEQVCAEKLAQKYNTEFGWRWEWSHAPGATWDWGDALTGCWVAAALSGLSSGGTPVPVARMAKRKPSVQMVGI